MVGGVYGQTSKDINQVDEKGLKQGYWVKKFDNDSIDYEGYFRDGRPVKLMTRYYRDGDVKSTFVYFDNDKACAAHIFYKDSVLMSQGLYRGEKKDSTWSFYNKKGQKIADENYNLGVKHGVSNVYYPSGKLYELITWSEGKKTGTWKQFFDTGVPKVEGNYVDEQLDGWTKFYFVDGKVSHEGLYAKNVKDGPWNQYTEKGDIAIVQRYDMGQLKNKKEVSEYIERKKAEK